MKKRMSLHLKQPQGFIRITWRMAWYSVVIWFLAIATSGLVILPWYYLVLPLLIFWLTIFYFRRSDRSWRSGIFVSLFWFAVVAGLDFLEIIGLYYSNLGFYFSDFRNWLKYPLILLLPVIYSLVLENSHFGKIRSMV